MRQTRALSNCFSTKTFKTVVSDQFSLVSFRWLHFRPKPTDDYCLTTARLRRCWCRIPACKLFLLHTLAQHHGQVAAGGVEHRCQPLRRRIDEEEQLREDLFLARHGGQRLD